MTITIPASPTSRIRIPAKVEKPKSKAAPPEDTPLIGVSVKQALQMLGGINKRTFLPLIKDGKIRTVQIGRRIIVSVQSLRDFVDGKKEPCGSGKEENHRDTEI